MIMGDLFGIFCQRHLDLENASSPNKQTNKQTHKQQQQLMISATLQWEAFVKCHVDSA